MTFDEQDMKESFKKNSTNNMVQFEFLNNVKSVSGVCLKVAPVYVTIELNIRLWIIPTLLRIIGF